MWGVRPLQPLQGVKELLLDELCQSSFHHLFERSETPLTTRLPGPYLSSISKKNQDHVTSLVLSKNDYFIRQPRKGAEHDVLPEGSRRTHQSPSNSPSLLPPNTWSSSPFHPKPSAGGWKRKSYTEQEVINFIWRFKSGLELEGEYFQWPACNFLSISITLHASRTGKKSFGCHPLSKKYQSSIQTIESILLPPFWLNAIVLEQFLILMTSLYLSYQFNNYSIYASIIIAYIYHVLGHLIQTIVIRKICAWVVNGHFNKFVCSLQSQNEFPIKLYGYSLLPYWLLF